VAAIIRAVHRVWWLVVAGWVALAAGAVLFAPAFVDVATYDDTAFLPASDPAIIALLLIHEGWPDDELTNALTIVVERADEPLTEQDEQYLGEVVAWLRSDEAPATVGPVMTHLDNAQLASQLVSDDGHAAFLLAGFHTPPYTLPSRGAVEDIRAHLETTSPPQGLGVHTTGQLALAADEQAAIEATVARTTIIATVLVALILLFVYRALIAPLGPLLTITAAFIVARATVALLAQAGMDVTALYETFAIVLVFGAGTDYCLFLLSRYHEELGSGQRAGFRNVRRFRHGTLAATTLVMVAVLASSAATTMVGFSTQGLAEFGLYRTMGPALAVTIGVTMVAAITLAPALMRMAGRYLFWPEALGTPVMATGGEDVPLVQQRVRELGLADLPRDEDGSPPARRHAEVAP
jgi:putative drug exporter of the RND superfamily